MFLVALIDDGRGKKQISDEAPVELIIASKSQPWRAARILTSYQSSAQKKKVLKCSIQKSSENPYKQIVISTTSSRGLTRCFIAPTRQVPKRDIDNCIPLLGYRKRSHYTTTDLLASIPFPCERRATAPLGVTGSRQGTPKR